jgi:NAD(P)-dependent dehydrogenase (short-subunit alcohol dehydrogenase family)
LGADVVIASRTPAELEVVAERIRGHGVRCLAREINIRDIPAVEALKAEVLEVFGRVDFLINNAGGQFLAAPLDISDNGWRSVVDLT